MVTPPRQEERRTGRKVERRLQRLPNFQATLKKENGLPPIRWQKRLEFGEEGDATFLRKPVSHRRKGRRREEVMEAEASFQMLRGDKLEEDKCTSSPHTPGNMGLEASIYNQVVLHSFLSPGPWYGGRHRGFCYSCGMWGNMEPIA
mgnify:CR=1 FL=1